MPRREAVHRVASSAPFAAPTTSSRTSAVQAVRAATARGSCSSSTTWKLVPPKPNALTAARRGWSPERRSQGRRVRVEVERRAARARSAGFGCSTLIVGGSTLWCSASAALIRPAAPAAALVWPICDLTLPEARCAAVATAPRRRPGAASSTSAASPAGAGAVRLDQPDVAGVDARRRVGAPQRPRLALRARRVDALVPAVAGGADAPDHGVDPVAVALGVGQPLSTSMPSPSPMSVPSDSASNGRASPSARTRASC